MTELAVERRCCLCGDVWSDDAAPCCMDPVDEMLVVTRAAGRRPGMLLESVLARDGGVIAAVWVPAV